MKPKRRRTKENPREQMKPIMKRGEPRRNEEKQTDLKPLSFSETRNGGGGDGGEPQASCGYGGSSEHVTCGS